MDNTVRTFPVHYDKIEEVCKALNKLVVKANRYGTPFNYSVGQAYKREVAVCATEETSGQIYKASSYWVSAVDVTVTMEAVKMNGWECEARIEDDPVMGRIVLPYGNNERKEEWKDTPLRCDHCNTNRRRKIVYMVKNQNGEERMVGNACLHEYTGINPAGLFSWAMVHDIFLDMTVGERVMEGEGSCEEGKYRYFKVDEIMSLACDIIKANGFTPTSEPCSTKLLLQNAIVNHDEPSEEGKAKAEQIIAWFKANQFKYSRFEDEIRDMCVSGFVRNDMLGTIACAPGIYDRAMEKEVLTNMEGKSMHVGRVGERLHVAVLNLRCVSSWVSCYNGYSDTVNFLYKILDENGNVYIWKTAKDIPDGVTEIVGTVKGHGSYNGIAQTELTRCKVVA